jgi:hypothetical protein
MKISLKLYLGIAIGLVIIASGLAFLAVFSPSASLAHTSYMLVQDTPDEVSVVPEVLERISWSAVFAGSFLSLIVMFLLNLLGIALGLSQINPENRYDSGDASGVATGTMIWIAISNLVALFIGGWIAAYFAGIPEGTDGALHGLMVWAVTSLVTILLVMTGLGKIMNGLAMLVSSGMNLTGSLAGGAAHVTSGAVNTAGNVLGSAGNVAAQTVSLLSNSIQSSANLIGNSFAQLTDTAIENMPVVQNALAYQDLTLDDIRFQAERLLRQAGEDPDRMENQVRAGVRDVQDGVKQIVRNPQDLSRVLDITLNRIFTRGEALVNDVDRESLVNLLMENGNMSREQAMAQLERWEEQFNQVKTQTQQARETAMQKAEEFRQQAEQKAQEMYQMAQARVAEMEKEVETRLNQAKEEAENAAREAAQAAKETFTKVATAVAVAMIIGGIAAAIGGYYGTPETLPDMNTDEADGDVRNLDDASNYQVVWTLQSPVE